MASLTACDDGETAAASVESGSGSSSDKELEQEPAITGADTSADKQESALKERRNKRRRSNLQEVRLQRKDSQRLLNRLDGISTDDDRDDRSQTYHGRKEQQKRRSLTQRSKSDRSLLVATASVVAQDREEPLASEPPTPARRRCRSSDFAELLLRGGIGVGDDGVDDDENDGNSANIAGRQLDGEEDDIDRDDSVLTDNFSASALTYLRQGDTHSPHTRRRRLHLATPAGEDDSQTITTSASSSTTTTGTTPTTPPPPPGTKVVLSSSLIASRHPQCSPRQQMVPTPGMSPVAATEKDRIMAALEAREAATEARQRRREQDSGAAVASNSRIDWQHDASSENDIAEYTRPGSQAAGEIARQPMNMNFGMGESQEQSVHSDDNIVENDRWQELEMVRGQWGRSDRTLFTVATSATLMGAESTASSSGTRPVRATTPGAVQMTGRAYGLVRPAWYRGHGRVGGNVRGISRDRRRSRSRSCSRPARRRSRHHRPSCGTNGSGSPLDEEGGAIRRSSESTTSSFGAAAATVQWFARGSGGGRDWAVEATIVDDDDRGADCCVAYVNAESMPSTMKLIWSDRPWALCLGAVAIGAIGAIVAVSITLLVQSFSSDGGMRGRTGGNDKPLAPTMSPTIAPTASAAPTIDINFFRDLLSEVTHVSDLTSPETPQHRALWWLAEVDVRAQSDHTSIYQRYAMTVLFFATGGPDSWIRKAQWLDASLNECSWDPSTIVCEPFGGRNNVVELDLSKKGLDGTLPSEIRLLRNLESLVLNSNLLRGKLPTEIGLLSNLGKLEVEKNSFHGALPSTISNLLSLDDLDVSDNRFSGTIPQGLFLLSELRSLDLSSNRFNGTISDAIESLRMLNSFDASSNELSGTLSTALARMRNLASVRLDNNFISGPIPDVLRLVGLRKEFSCANNRLNGSLAAVAETPEDAMNIFRDIRLEKLDLSGNDLTGNITAALFLFLRIVDLNLSDNMLSGSIPSFGELHLLELEYFDLSKNLFTGHFPVVSSAPKLKFCDLRSNNFDGILSQTWDEAPLLEHLDLGLNVIRSEIPPQLGNLTSLEFLGLRNSKLRGSIPASIGNLQRLKFLDLGMNTLSRLLPRELTSLHVLEILNLESNRISGSILPEIANLESLRVLSLRSNFLRGLIPPEIGSMNSLEQLHLEDNELSGSVPASVCLLKNSIGGSLTDFSLDKEEVACGCCD